MQWQDCQNRAASTEVSVQDCHMTARTVLANAGLSQHDC
jgi:hypothetical protein